MVQPTFLSVLDYGDAIYMHTSASTLQPLNAAYHSALHFISGDHLTHIIATFIKILVGRLLRSEGRNIFYNSSTKAFSINYNFI